MNGVHALSERGPIFLYRRDRPPRSFIGLFRPIFLRVVGRIVVDPSAEIGS
jgi:hypothetical protein